MKKLLFLGIGSALVFTMGGVGPAQADGGPHRGFAQAELVKGVQIANVGADRCAACHRAHTAKAEFLLKQAQPQLCYTCHSSGGLGSGTDVANGVDANAAGSGLRGGGFNTAAIGSGAATKDMGTQQTYGISSTNQAVPVLAVPVATTSRHQIDGTTAGTAWGNGPLDTTGTKFGKSLILECGSCHDPHGNKNYRILRPMPVDSQWIVTPAVLAADGVTVVTAAVMSPKTNVVIPDAVAKQYTTTNYWLSGDANSPAGVVGSTAYTNGTSAVVTAGGAGVATDGYIQNVAAWCTTCHTRYLAPTKSYKTASGDATFMYRHRSDANYKAGAANCITCHVSHGSNASVAGMYSNEVALPDGTGSNMGDSKLLRVNNRGTCLMCHNV